MFQPILRQSKRDWSRIDGRRAIKIAWFGCPGWHTPFCCCNQVLFAFGTYLFIHIYHYIFHNYIYFIIIYIQYIYIYTCSLNRAKYQTIFGAFHILAQPPIRHTSHWFGPFTAKNARCDRIEDEKMLIKGIMDTGGAQYCAVLRSTQLNKTLSNRNGYRYTQCILWRILNIYIYMIIYVITIIWAYIYIMYI